MARRWTSAIFQEHPRRYMRSDFFSTPVVVVVVVVVVFVVVVVVVVIVVAVMDFPIAEKRDFRYSSTT